MTPTFGLPLSRAPVHLPTGLKRSGRQGAAHILDCGAISCRPGEATGWTGALVLALVLMLTDGLTAGAARAQAPQTVSVEINRLDQSGEDCRVTLVEQNGRDHDFSSLKLDLVVFDAAGVVTKRLAVETAPLKAGRTFVRTFDFKAIGCKDIGRVLLNDVLACAGGGLDAAGCLDAVAPASRAAAPFGK